MSNIVMIGGADGPTQIYLDGDFGLFGKVMGLSEAGISERMLIIYFVAVAVMMIAAYLIGNISPSILMAKKYGIDIKKEGSGNAGTTNALRVLGKKAGVITLTVDVLKGVAAVLLGWLICGHMGAMACVVGVICGHIWPVIYRFKGGKGVATTFGALMGLNPLLGLSALVIVAIGVLISKRMSVGSILGAATFPIVCYFLEGDFLYAGIVLAIIILVKHRANIVRLCKGEEPKLSIFDKEKKQ